MCRLVACQFLCSQVGLVFCLFFSNMHLLIIKISLEVTSKLHSFFSMGNCVQLRFPHLQQKYLALALFSLLSWFYYVSLSCIRALYQQNSLPRLHSSLLHLIATYSFINLDTVTPLVHFLAKRNLCISLCVDLFCWQSCV